MNKIVHLSLTKKDVPIRVDVVQYATTPSIVFVLDDYTPGSGATASLYIKKPDGTEIYNSCTISGNQVTYKPTTQSFASLGTSKCQLQIIESGDTAVSFLIYADVTENIIDSSAIESQDEFTALEEALQTVSSYDARITANTNNIAQDRAILDSINRPLVLGYAGGTGGGITQPDDVVVPSGAWKTDNPAFVIPQRGFWLVRHATVFQGNATGVRAVRFSASQGGQNFGYLFSQTVNNVGATNTAYIQSTFTRNVTSTYSVYPQFFQNSGEDLTVYQRFELIRLGDTYRTT